MPPSNWAIVLTFHSTAIYSTVACLIVAGIFVWKPMLGFRIRGWFKRQ